MSAWPPASRSLRLAVHLLVITVLSVLQAVADATPLESLHVAGIHNGGDYDSVVQPRVLMLTGIPDGQGPLLTPLGDSPDRIEPVGLASSPEPAPSSVQSRAPPAR